MDIENIKKVVEKRTKDKEYGNWDENLWAKIDDIMGLGYSSKYPDIWSIYPDIAEIEKIWDKVPSDPTKGGPQIKGNSGGRIKAAIRNLLDVIKSADSTGAVSSPGSAGMTDASAGLTGSVSGSAALSTIENDCLKLLVANSNIILSGAPGTGKTYMANNIARALTGNDKSKIGFVQFHPSYDYTDFVEGLRPTPPTGPSIGFEYKEGIFRAFCEKALESLELYNAYLAAMRGMTVPGTGTTSPTVGSGSLLASQIAAVYANIVSDVLRGVKHKIKTITGITKDLYVNVTTKNLYVKNNSADVALTLDMMKRISDILKTEKEVREVKDFRKTTGIKNWDTDLRALIIYIYHIIETDGLGSDPGITATELNNPNSDGKDAQPINYPYFVFIIDEINRGEMSKVFGELFFSIDPGYRGTKGKVRTQYANMVINPNPFDDALSVTDPNNYGHFFVPENVYIIGTMNDIDRSVDTMDFAMRRRFLIKEIKAKDTQDAMLRDLTTIKEINSSVAAIEPLVIDKMDALNEIIEKRVVKIKGTEYKLNARLGSSYSLGASYFQKYYKYNNYDDLWTNHIEGILREYLRGTSKPDDDLEVLKNVYTNA